MTAFGALKRALNYIRKRQRESLPHRLFGTTRETGYFLRKVVSHRLVHISHLVSIMCY